MIAGINVTVEDSLFAGTDGTWPKCGLDIEVSTSFAAAIASQSVHACCAIELYGNLSPNYRMGVGASILHLLLAGYSRHPGCCCLPTLPSQL